MFWMDGWMTPSGAGCAGHLALGEAASSAVAVKVDDDDGVDGVFEVARSFPVKGSLTSGKRRYPSQGTRMMKACPGLVLACRRRARAVAVIGPPYGTLRHCCRRSIGRYDGTYKRLPTCSAPSTLFRHFSLSIFPPHHDHTGKIRRCKETFHRVLNIAVAAARCLALLGTLETPPNAPPSLPALCGTPKAPHRRQPNHCCPAVVTPFPPSAALPWFVAHPRPGDDRTPVDVPLLVLTKAPTPGSLSSALDPLSSLPPSQSPRSAPSNRQQPSPSVNCFPFSTPSIASISLSPSLWQLSPFVFVAWPCLPVRLPPRGLCPASSNPSASL